MKTANADKWRRVRSGEWSHPRYGVIVKYDTGWTIYPRGTQHPSADGRYRTLREAKQKSAALYHCYNTEGQSA